MYRKSAKDELVQHSKLLRRGTRVIPPASSPFSSPLDPFCPAMMLLFSDVNRAIRFSRRGIRGVENCLDAAAGVAVSSGDPVIRS